MWPPPMATDPSKCGWRDRETGFLKCITFHSRRPRAADGHPTGQRRVASVPPSPQTRATSNSERPEETGKLSVSHGRDAGDFHEEDEGATVLSSHRLLCCSQPCSQRPLYGGDRPPWLVPLVPSPTWTTYRIDSRVAHSRVVSRVET